jgi:energy-coupling factor transporter transmembrane protein EcfT
MSLMPGGKCMLQSDEEADEEYALVQRLLPLFKETMKKGKKARKLRVGDVI